MDDRVARDSSPHSQQDDGSCLSPPADGLINPLDGRRYWESAAADVNGMLGGIPAFGEFSSVSRIDLQGSRTFLAKLGIGVKCGRKPVVNALDAGAGCVIETSSATCPECNDALLTCRISWNNTVSGGSPKVCCSAWPSTLM